MINIVALVVKVAQTAQLNVYAELPSPPPDPVMRVEENGVFAPSSQMPDHLYELDLELQTWATTKLAAYQLVEDFTGLLRGQPSNQFGAVTRFQLVGNQYLRDPETLVNGVPGPRYISQIRVFAHP
jgi:hypothetical protein